MFSKILIANRGEIACRIARSAQALGYRTVAVFSDADAQAPHVSLADEAVRLGPAPAAESYLSIPALLDAARRTGADAVHPGYGFLSERAEFAQACQDAGLVFIGPPPQAIRAMGDKAAAKRLMIEAGVPCAPGYLGDDQHDATLCAEGKRLGVPLLVKAVAGGGGRGMRLVRDLAELPEAIAAARREAMSAFGDDTLMLERLIERGRHIEVQVLADRHGHVIHLGERDCSTQRRRQKLIEEAPSPVADEALRQAMGADAVAAARAVGYVGAGTVEFIVSTGADGRLQHHFLEMNTRLQVEHPVTECVTGLDLVAWQLRVAAGQALPWHQSDIRLSGHAIEVRLCAEDPYAGWMPQTGVVRHWQPSRSAQAGHEGLGTVGVRVHAPPNHHPATDDSRLRIDHGLREGQDIGPHYDAMVAKFIAHGRTRAEAARQLVRALEDTPLMGVATNARLLRDLLRSADFAESRITTDTLDGWMTQVHPLLQRPEPPEDAWRVAFALHGSRSDHDRAVQPGRTLRTTGAAIGSGMAQEVPKTPLRPAGLTAFDLTLTCGAQSRTARLPLDGVERLSMDEAPGHHRLAIDGVQSTVLTNADGSSLHLAWDGHVFTFTEPGAAPQSLRDDDPLAARAPVTGRLVTLRVAAGDTVTAGQPLASIEAMKMEMVVIARCAGRVAAVHADVGVAVASGALLVTLEPVADDPAA
jgi:geranyl-CoA carboxylase alpha subunit